MELYESTRYKVRIEWLNSTGFFYVYEGVKKDTPAAEAQSSQKNVEPGSDFAVYQGRQMKR